MTTTNALAPMPRFQKVPFHDTEILAAQIGDEVRVPMPGFCAAIGLEWEPQRKRIMRDEVMREGTSMMEVPSAGGMQRALTLPLAIIPGFLFTADTRRYRAEVQARMTLFRRECFDVLHRHFARPTAAPQPIAPRALAAPAWQERATARAAAPTLIAAIAAERRPAARRYLHIMLEQDAGTLGLTAPRLDQLGVDAMSADALVGRFVEGLEVLTARKLPWNHFGRKGLNGRMALILPEIARLFTAYNIDIPVDAELRDALRAGCSRYRIRSVSLDSVLTRKRIFATTIEPWPIEGGLA